MLVALLYQSAVVESVDSIRGSFDRNLGLYAPFLEAIVAAELPPGGRTLTLELGRRGVTHHRQPHPPEHTGPHQPIEVGKHWRGYHGGVAANQSGAQAPSF